jgi:putative transposase
VKGRKRHLLVDTQGFILNVVVSEANLSERDLAPWLLQSVQEYLPRLKLIWADAGYRGERFLDAFQVNTGVRLEVVKRLPEQRYFQVEPKRWVVERTFAWLGNARRLAKDYELYFKSSAAMIYAAFTRLMLRRLARLASP